VCRALLGTRIANENAVRLGTTFVVYLVGTVVGCGDSGTGRQRFEAEVLPVLEARCLSTTCHGVAGDAEVQGEVIDWTQFFVRVTAAGRARDNDQAYERAKSRINTIERPELSTLLRKPLAEASGGLPHWGGDELRGPDDPAYRAVRDWIAGESGGGEGKDPAELSPLEQRFAADVLPSITTRQCLNRNCHGGPTALKFTDFATPIFLDGEPVFATADVERNYTVARHFLNLGGASVWGRLVRKVLPLDADPTATSGIAHRAGNLIFFRPGDPEIEAMSGWADAERAQVLGTAIPPVVRGVVFVRGPVVPEAPFDLRVFSPGTDLWVIDRQPEHPGNPSRNLTGALHPGESADARDPAVSHDALRVAFAMRRSASDSHNIYEVRLDGTGLRQLTTDADPDVANRHPVYGPDGRIYFVSTRAKTQADGVDLPDSELWAVDPSSGEQQRLTYTPSPLARPFWIGTGKFYGTIGFTELRSIGGRWDTAVMRVPIIDRNPAYHADREIHPHHGQTLPEDVVWGMRTMSDGRYAAVLLDRTATYPAGALAVIERQFGPELPAGAEDEAATPGFRHAVTRLDSARRWWDPAPGNDNSLFAAVAASAAPDRPRIERVWLAEDPLTGGPVIQRETRLSDVPPGDAVGEWEPEPILVRPLEDDPTHERAWDPSASTGIVNVRHGETLEAIFAAGLVARGPKVIRDDIVAVRALVSLPVPEGRMAEATATAYGPAAVLVGEVPVPDGSLFAEIPANAAFRIQFVDADGMATGGQANRWFFVAPGETFPAGVSPTRYPTDCAGCHGALDGVADHALGVPDAVTSASITLATHEQRNPRRPKPPIQALGPLVATDFLTMVRPLVARSCAACHPELDPRPDGTFDTAYRWLLDGGRVVPSHARESPAIERIRTVCPGDPPLDADERLTFIRWVDAGAAYRSAPP
jgi:hypothetical protein